MRQDRRRLEASSGITLIALVVTIIILVILAAISINLILNGRLINRTEVGEKLTELSKIEEKANLIYADKKMEEYQNKEKEKVTIEEIVDELKRDNYQFKEVDGDNVVDIHLDKNDISMLANSEEVIQVTLERGESAINYYVIVNGQYYRIYLNSLGVILDKIPSTLEELSSKSELKLSANSEIIEVQLEKNIIKVKSKGKIRRSTNKR